MSSAEKYAMNNNKDTEAKKRLKFEPLAKLSNGKQSTLIKAPDKPVFRADGALLGHLLSYFVVFIKIRA